MDINDENQTFFTSRSKRSMEQSNALTEKTGRPDQRPDKGALTFLSMIKVRQQHKQRGYHSKL
eukprot:1041731-Pelagomonas_calceolata.AAC.2